MSFKQKAIAAGLGGAALLLSAGAAFAYPAEATASVNVRSGPSTTYAVLDVLSPGERVDVQRCRGSWCFVSHRGADGWVSANYLSRGYASRPPAYYPPPPPPRVIYRPPPRYVYPVRPPFWHRHHHRHHRHYNPGFCVGSPNASFCVNP